MERLFFNSSLSSNDSLFYSDEIYWPHFVIYACLHVSELGPFLYFELLSRIC